MLGLRTMSGKALPIAAAGAMKWTWNLYGAMSLEKAAETFQAAISSGLVHIDTADCYPGTDGAPDNETFVGQQLRKSTLPREDIFIATKCAIVLDPADLSKRIIRNDPDYILGACDQSLSRLGLASIDLFYLHRIANEGKDIEASMRGMHRLVENGKIRHIGLSEASAETIRRADAELKRLSAGVYGLSAVQTEYSLLRRAPEIDGIFDICRELNIAFIAYAPLCRGLTANPQLELASGDFRASVPKFQGDNLSKNRALALMLKELSEKKGCTSAQLSIAWAIAQGKSKGIVVVPLFGTSDPAHLIENYAAVGIQVSTDELRDINAIVPVNAPKGARYSEGAMRAYNFKPDVEFSN